METRRWQLAGLFLTGVAAVYTVALLLVRSLPTLPDPGAIAIGITFDLTLVVPLLYYLIMVRRVGWPVLSTVPIFLISWWIASRLLPVEYHDGLRIIEVILPLVELAVLAFLVIKVRRLVLASRRVLGGGTLDFFDAVRTAATETLGHPRVAHVLAYEVAIFYYAFARHPRTPLRSHTYRYDQGSEYGSLLLALCMVLLFEMVAVHFLLWLWSPVAAWIHLALTLYTFLWLIGDFRAMRVRPVTIDGDTLHVRLGIRWNVVVPRDAVAAVREVSAPRRGKEHLRVTAKEDEELVLELHAPIAAEGPYGFRRSVRSIGVRVDDRERFVTDVQNWLVAEPTAEPPA